MKWCGAVHRPADPAAEYVGRNSVGGYRGLAWWLLIAVGVAPHVLSAEPRRESVATTTSLQMVWSDEFSVDGPPHPADWGYERGFVRNDELQWYQPANAQCAGGMLIIEARRERIANPDYAEQSPDWRRNRQYADYTSASVTTRRKRQWRYGRFEMRGRIDVRPGMWPAFWTLGSARPWPGSGEIDVMEYYDGTLLANVAWLGERGAAKWDEFKRPIREFTAADWADQFHTWRMDWNRESIQLYVDGELLNSTALSDVFNADRQRSNPFHEPHYLLLNLAIGGTRGGDPSATEFPAKFEVDYVRVYQQVDQAPQPGE